VSVVEVLSMAVPRTRVVDVVVYCPAQAFLGIKNGNETDLEVPAGIVNGGVVNITVVVLAQDGRFRITKLETAEVPAALQHTWSGHAKSHVSEVYKKLLKQREWRLRWAEKTGTGFALPGHQQPAAEASNGKPGKLLPFRKVG
jgi:hypothetical protein